MKRILLGLGNIGTAIAKRLKGFDVIINAATRSGKSKHSNLIERIVPISEVNSIIGDADFIILALPLTEQSKHLVDKEFISQMKPTSLLVNISRGPIVDESALYDALKNEQIAGAAMDVVQQPGFKPGRRLRRRAGGSDLRGIPLD